MASLAGPPGARIVIDPDDLRDVVTRLRGAAVLYSSAGRELAARPLPAMPSFLAAALTEVICSVNAELQDLAIEFLTEAGTLAARATWAALGGGDAISWLIPGLHYSPSAPDAPRGPAEALPPITEEQIRASEEWAIELLDGMHDTLRHVERDGARLGSRADDLWGEPLVDFAEEYADEIPVKALGKFTTAAGVALDLVEHWDQGWQEAGARAGLSAAGGAVGTGLCMLVLAPTGPGVAGCIFVGGALGATGGDYAGDEVFEE